MPPSRGLPEDVLYGVLPSVPLNEALAAVNAATRLTYVSQRSLQGTMGGWVLAGPDRDRYVLKVVSSHDTVGQVRESAEIAKSVEGPGCRVPHYRTIAYTPGVGTWYIQELLDGVPAEHITTGLVEDLLALNNRFADRALLGAYDYAPRVRAVLRGDEFGWRARVAAASPEGRALVTTADRLANACRGMAVHDKDAVHGDMALGNLLVSGAGKLVGCVDWDLAGRGDRGLDVARLLYACYADEAEGRPVEAEARRLLVTRVVAVSGEVGLVVYSLYWALMVADWAIRRAPAATGALIEVGRSMLADVT